jgi:hypothetical protein
VSGIPNTDKKVKFIAAGHLYGEGERPKIYPQTTLLANIDFINSLKPHFFISLGDNVGSGNDLNQIKRFNKIFVSKLKVPFYTAWGNHDGERTKLNPHCAESPILAMKKNIFVKFQTILG